MVVIMMGRKRTRQASKMASAGDSAVHALGFEGEIDHHDGVLLDDADQHDDSDERVDIELVVKDQQRGQRAQSGGGQTRENRDGVDEALVENPQHHVDHQDGHGEQEPIPASEDWKAAATPWKLVRMVAGRDSRAIPSTRSTASPSETPGARLNEMVTAGSCPRCATVRGPTAGAKLRHGGDRDQAAARRVGCRAGPGGWDRAGISAAAP